MGRLRPDPEQWPGGGISQNSWPSEASARLGLPFREKVWYGLPFREKDDKYLQRTGVDKNMGLRGWTPYHLKSAQGRCRHHLKWPFSLFFLWAWWGIHTPQTQRFVGKDLPIRPCFATASQPKGLIRVQLPCQTRSTWHDTAGHPQPKRQQNETKSNAK